ncbi:cell adhesion molecule 3 isoform X1 [Silurus meridionalis]|uniref:cell adhesion molecule 3 isoform X1 n=1 Tax=Silurus meridionalis TaxID=175797 RepID=UPI001EEBA4F4|nr:cell adhesion molecule 3 isoform X1 [Silurus meridionalis]XP_046732020.1 cell adhesion molecule 3 isoform X1 [Silurus meridionalis]XP_046732021.1 cell adhesion molecule 3 isoform X1 [Silurus meridionalis]XP_046732022.1 cell adhesion molecule 3 isoform X1 [Silurus meridionalis]XP_046732024.1 cell adhesion molecule 3 isoform X1 [Silurus meridionalis]XP_046732025.1 cell adhesion molecule 3 isoform X1 [Silurus meridionalis]
MREFLQVNMAFSSFPLSTVITLLLLVASIQSNSMYDDEEDPFQPVTSDETVAEGGTVTLTCRVAESDNSSLQWSNTAQQTLYFGAKRALRDHRIQLHKSTSTELSITISNVQLSDDGEYTCSIFTMPVRIARATVTVLGVPGKPVITGFEDPVQEGGSVTLTCTSTGSKPPAQLYWYKGQEKLEARPNVVESNLNEPTYTVTSVLTLRVTRSDNNAMIGCAVDHPSITNGEKRTEQPLSVLFSPSVMIKPESDLPREGERFFLHCMGNGNPEPLSFRWHKKDAEFPPHVREEGPFLRFDALNKSDNGVYLCHTDNGVGWNEGSYTLQVQEDAEDPTAMSSSSGVDHAVIGGVVAVIVFIMLCLLIVLGRYLIRHKGTYLTHEAKGSDDAQDADTAIINAEGGHSGIEDKKEYFI